MLWRWRATVFSLIAFGVSFRLTLPKIAYLTDADRFVDHDARKRNDRNLGGAAADIHDHVAHRLGHIQADTDGGCHRGRASDPGR